jgi:superfamily I DNA/RNA helicase
LSAFAKLDKGVQGAVQSAIAGFANGHHGEAYLKKVPGSLDDRIRLLRVDGAWYGAVLIPDSGDTYCLLTILPLDEAVGYATSHRVGVNQATGMLEVSNPAALQQLQPSLQAAAGPDGTRLFADVSDADLTRLGIDTHVRQLVRLLVNDADLDALQPVLPAVQYTALHALASGMTVEEAHAEAAQVLPGDTPDERIECDDLVAAMERTPDQVAFVSGQEELQLILAHPFAAWRTFLHPSQREIAYRRSYSGPAQVTGGPGTGKTVTVLHRAAFLAARAASAPGPTGPGAAETSAPGPDAAPILLTTFNGNLADALQGQLDLLIRDPAVRRQIQVRNVDRLAYSIVKETHGTPVIADERMLRARWAEAAAAFGLDLTPAFLKNEWEQVILAQDLRNEHAYLTCLRTGRGRPLTKAQRSRVWQAAQQVTAELATARQTTHLQLANEATHLLRKAGAPRYRHILVDEAQDLHPAQWRLLRAAVAEGPDDLFIAADPHQRIYSNRVSLASLRISVRGRSRKLSLNYRTTQEILAWAMPLLGSDPVTGLDGEVDSLPGYRSPMHGQRPQVRLAATREEEFAFLSERIRSWLAAGLEPGAIGVTARSAGLVREAREALKADGFDTTSVSVRGGAAGVRAGTMHAMKGLEFQAVAVIGVEEGVVPAPAAITADDEDPLAHAQDLQLERCVLFVACTRARDHLYVSATGEPSAFLPLHGAAAPLPDTDPAPTSHPAVPAPTQVRQPADPPVADDDAVLPDGSVGLRVGDVSGPRKVSMRELLRRREELWAPRLRGASLVAEADLRPDHTNQVAEVLARLYRKLPDPTSGGEGFLLRWPACLASAMAGVAAENFLGGQYWPVLWKVTEFEGSALDQRIWGRAFNRAVERLGMATFPGLPLTYVGPILMHAGLPSFCLRSYFRLLLDRRRLDPGMDAENFLAWGTAPGRKRRLGMLHVPAQRFLTQGGDYALDVVDRSLDLLDLLADPDPDLDGIRLPARFIEVAREEIAAQGPGHHRGGTGRVDARSSASRPRIALDPYGAGVQIILPAVGEAPDGVATWRVTADGNPMTVRSRAQWVGAAEAAPETAHPLARPARTVHVSLVGWDHVTELEVVQPADPILFFADDGRRLPARLPLPPDHVWILRPADRDLVVLGEVRTITEAPVPFGWEGWHLQLASLDKVHSLSLAGGPAHAVQGFARPRLLLGAPIPGVATPYGSPIYPQPPQLWLPDAPDSEISWRVEVRPATHGAPLASREIRGSGTVDIWADVPRPILGAFDITVRGPLGRGMRRAIFVAEGVSVSYRPAVRALKVSGLEPGQAELRAPVGASVHPPRLSFRAADRAHVAELRAGAETEPVVITPPHVEVLCAGAGAGSWTAAPIHAASEDIPDLGRLLVRAPGMALTADLEVWAGLQPVQTIPPSGAQGSGLTGYELPRARETVAHHGRAEFFLPWGQSRMPVGMVRPRRLATGAEVSDGQLIIRDCVPVDGLAAALYLARAPWRAPAVVPVPGDGVVPLPTEVSNAGPLRVLLRVEDPWVVADWPDWPGRHSYACDAPGIPAGDDAEEEALCRFLAGDGDLLASPLRLDRLWRLVHLADDLMAAGAPAYLRERCSAGLTAQPRRALAALLDTGLDSAASMAALIGTGLATARPVMDGDLRKAERLWGVVPAAAAVVCSRLLAEPAPADKDPLATLLDAALAQCGPNLEAMLGGKADPAARVGQFGPEAERLALLTPDQVDAVWQAAAVVPQALLDADTRAIAARQMFDARRTLAGPARDAAVIVRDAEKLVTTSPYRDAAALITARRHPERRGGWLALPAMSASLALVARIAARGNEACRAFERGWRPRWADLARQAPGLASIDLVLAEALIAGAERTRFAEEAA